MKGQIRLLLQQLVGPESWFPVMSGGSVMISVNVIG